MRRARYALGLLLIGVSALLGIGALSRVPGAAADSASCTPVAPPAGDYANPVANCDAPDPDVIFSGGVYYAFSTGGAYGDIQLFTSPDLTTWAPEPWPGPLQSEPPWVTRGYEWAPDVVEVGDTWLMYYATRSTSLGVECISVAVATSVGGPYQDNSAGPLECMTGMDPLSGLFYGGSLDPFVFQSADGGLILLWKTNDGSSADPAYIWGEPLSADGRSFAPGSSPALLLRQDQSWESTIENPDMVLVGGSYYLFYSGGNWDSAYYSVGYAICLGPLGPCAKPDDRPILASAGWVSGPGGESIFQDTGGNWWMAYHAWTTWRVGYQNGGARSLRIDPLCFVRGVPVVLGPTIGDQPLHQTCPAAAGQGYRLVASDGGIFSFDTPFYGSTGSESIPAPIVGIARDNSTGGYWEAGVDGSVYCFGGARFMGSLSGATLAAPVVAIVASPDGGGYWLAASDGGVFAFGDATFHGSMGGTHLNQPVVGMAVDSWTGGYWLVAADGGVFAFDAPFLGSAGGLPLRQPVVGMAPYDGGLGYWLVAADGGVFSYDAPFDGSLGGVRLNEPVVGMAPDGFGGSYWLVAADGGVFAFPGAGFFGSTGWLPLVRPVIAMSVS